MYWYDWYDSTSLLQHGELYTRTTVFAWNQNYSTKKEQKANENDL